jgi:hypothetical protein
MLFNRRGRFKQTSCGNAGVTIISSTSVKRAHLGATQMLDSIISFFNFLLGLFRSLPEEQQEKIKKEVAAKFEKILREFYQQATKG